MAHGAILLLYLVGHTAMLMVIARVEAMVGYLCPVRLDRCDRIHCCSSRYVTVLYVDDTECNVLLYLLLLYQVLVLLLL